MHLYCNWWLVGAGLPLPACFLPPWAGMAVWPDLRLVRPLVQKRAMGTPEFLAARQAALSVPQIGTEVAGPGPWPGRPEPGSPLAPVIGPAGPLGTLWAEQVGPDVPDPWLETIGPPGTPIAPGSAGAAGDPISE